MYDRSYRVRPGHQASRRRALTLDRTFGPLGLLVFEVLVKCVVRGDVDDVKQANVAQYISGIEL